MKLFIDCEFNGYKGELLSMGIVDTGGWVFYEELKLPTKFRTNPWPSEVNIPLDPWVSENVSLIRKSDEKVTLSEFSQRLEKYLNRYTDIHLIADWPDDIRYFCDMLITGPGTRIDTPPLTIEIRRDLDAVSLNPHNALADAIAIRDKYFEVTQDPDFAQGPQGPQGTRVKIPG